MVAKQYRKHGLALSWQSGKQENANTRSLKTLLASDRLFTGRIDVDTRQVLQQAFSRRLSGGAMHLLECLAVSPLGIPLDLLFEHFDGADEFFDDLDKASFIDQSQMSVERVSIVPLVREAVLQAMSIEHKAELEQNITDCYSIWLNDLQKFHDDSEKASLIAEVNVRQIRSRQLLDAAE